MDCRDVHGHPHKQHRESDIGRCLHIYQCQAANYVGRGSQGDCACGERYAWRRPFCFGRAVAALERSQR